MGTGETPGCVLVCGWLRYIVSMNSSAKVPHIPFRRNVYYGENGEVFITASGEWGLSYAQVFAPPAEEIRSMLFEVRRKQNWSQAHSAAVLGVPKNTVRAWENGYRHPCGSSKKLIWLVHTLFFHPNELLKDLDNLVTWGHGRKEFFVFDPEQDFASIATPDETLGI